MKVAKRKFIKIRGIIPEHAYLNTFCQIFSEATGIKMVYKGESMPTLMHKAVNQLLVKKRKHASVADVVDLLEWQKNKCNCCSDALTNRR